MEPATTFVYGAWMATLTAPVCVPDGLEGLVLIPHRQLEPPPAESTGMAEFLSGVARDKLGTIAVLDLPRLVEAARSRAVPFGSGGA